MAKDDRKGGKQKHGGSRAQYFNKRKLYLASQNKQRRINRHAAFVKRKSS